MRQLRVMPMALALSASLCVRPVTSQAPTSAGDPGGLRGLIAAFFAEPFAMGGRVRLLDSAQARPDVDISLTVAVLPWACYGDKDKTVQALDALLTTAYLAGNMDEQLRRGKAADQVEAGLHGVLRVYARVRQKVRNYYVPEVDRWAARDSAGTLAVVADSLHRNSREDCDKSKLVRFPGKTRLEVSTDTTERAPRAGAA